jgi:hypothetical protein
MIDPKDGPLDEHSRLLAKIKKLLGRDLWQSPIKDQLGNMSSPQALVEGELLRMAAGIAAQKRIRSRGSKQAQRAIDQFRAAVQRANRPGLGLPEDLRLLLGPGLDRMLALLNGYAIKDQVFNQVLKRKKIAKPELPYTYEKDEAALAAARICQVLKIPLTTTRKHQKTTSLAKRIRSGATDEVSEASTFLKLAAILHGDETADMHHHCRRAKRWFHDRAASGASSGQGAAVL